MLSFQKPQPLNGEKLIEELTTAGFSVHPIFGLVVSGDALEIDLPDAVRPAIEGIVAAHTGAFTAEQAQQADERDQLAALRNKAKNVWAGTDSFTVAQRDKILAGLVLRATRGA